MLFLDWQSDGFVARLGLIVCAAVFLACVLWGIRNDRVLRRLLPAALLWHAVIWGFTTFWVLPYYALGVGADAVGYHSEGMAVAAMIRSGNWQDIPFKLGTDMMPAATGALYALFGGDIYGVLVFSAVLGFGGSLYFCRAFAQLARADQLRTYCLIILFMPSFAMWTGGYGKDSWICYGLGLAAYGYSLILRHGGIRGVGHMVAGLGIVTLIRPHIAALVVISMSLAYIWGLSRSRRGSIFARFATALALIAVSGLLYSVTAGFLGLSDVSADSMEEYAELHSDANAQGGSAVEVNAAPGVVGALRAYPRGIVRALLEPFPWEVHSFNEALAALENLFLLGFGVTYGRRIRRLLKGVVREPFLMFSLTLSLLLLLLLGPTPNLGLISRQRAQLLPFLFAVLIAPETMQRRTRPSRGETGQSMSGLGDLSSSESFPLQPANR